ncbi:hypothetical protein ACFQ8W_00175 [Streptomyces sp. NPDC056508]|uniref:hypothetical protein n=1 Tax=Streptomyces sp. NPDC056508 TaxID=3345845 RepID=UPI0036C797E7
MNHTTPTVHPVPGGFVVATQTDEDTYVVEGFIMGTDNYNGQAVSVPLSRWEASAAGLDAEIADHAKGIADYLAYQDRRAAETVML